MPPTTRSRRHIENTRCNTILVSFTRQLGKAGLGGGQLIRLKFGADVRNCIRHFLCIGYWHPAPDPTDRVPAVAVNGWHAACRWAAGVGVRVSVRAAVRVGLWLGLGLGLSASELLIAVCRYAIRGIGCRLPVPDTRPFSFAFKSLPLILH